MHEATVQKGVNVDKVNHAGDKPHEEKWEPAPKRVSKLKKVKEDNMKSYKEFLQSLDEKLIGKEHNIDKNKKNSNHILWNKNQIGLRIKAPQEKPSSITITSSILLSLSNLTRPLYKFIY